MNVNNKPSGNRSLLKFGREGLTIALHTGKVTGMQCQNISSRNSLVVFKRRSFSHLQHYIWVKFLQLYSGDKKFAVEEIQSKRIQSKV